MSSRRGYYWDKGDQIIFAMEKGNYCDRFYVFLGDVIGEPSQGGLEYHLIARGWNPEVPFPPLGEDPIPF